MKTRIITSIAIITFLLLIGFIDNPYLTKLVISIITILAMFEAKNLLNADEKVFYFLSLMTIFSIFINPFFIGVVSVLMIAGYVAYTQSPFNFLTLSFYPFLSLMFLEHLYLIEGMKVLGYLIVVVALTDSMAYVIGKNFGRKFINKGFSITSPNKTFEGVIGGIFSGTIIGSIVGMMFFDFFVSFIVSFLVSFSSVFGDLFESYLKRSAGVKDSGNILPGHGGILDRIDGYLFAAPLLYAIFIGMK